MYTHYNLCRDIYNDYVPAKEHMRSHAPNPKMPSKKRHLPKKYDKVVLNTIVQR